MSSYDDGEFMLPERIRNMIPDSISIEYLYMTRHTENRIAVGDNAVLDLITVVQAESP